MPGGKKPARKRGYRLEEEGYTENPRCFHLLDHGFLLFRVTRLSWPVLATGDWDYNRMETYYGYNTFLTLGYEAHYFQEPQRGHRRISGEVFEKAVTLLDEAAGARAKRAP
jgi:hypothetical protein